MACLDFFFETYIVLLAFIVSYKLDELGPFG